MCVRAHTNTYVRMCACWIVEPKALFILMVESFHNLKSASYFSGVIYVGLNN